MSDVEAGRFQSTTALVLSQPEFAEPKAYTDRRTKKSSGDPKFSVRLVIDPNTDDFTVIKKLCVDAARAKWPGRALSELKFPFTKGDDVIAKAKTSAARDNKTYDGNLDWLSGKITIWCRSTFRPKMAAIVNGKVADVAEDDKQSIQKHFFSGAEAHVVLKVNAYDEVGTNPAGVNIYLNEVFATGKGKKIGGNRSAASTFSGYAGKMSAEDPTSGFHEDEDVPGL